jgi:hypothetical protein
MTREAATGVGWIVFTDNDQCRQGDRFEMICQV